jgi:hypothetical protein
MKPFSLKSLMLFIVAICVTSTYAQPAKTYTFTTLNVDGLPQKVLFVTINEDGPREKYTTVISRYLADSEADFIGTQENFNFNNELYSSLSTAYDRDEFSGAIELIGGGLSLVNLKFPCDGLSAFWKREHQVTDTERVPWVENCGKFDHCSDDLCAKGFRRYECTLEGGINIRLYNMHMDASTGEDERALTDGPDRETRLKQWIQLHEDIMSRMDERPVIVLGDLNSYYARDSIKAKFIDAIEDTGVATVSDVWIEMERNGQYPELEDGVVTEDASGWAHEGETLDKIIYINPTNSTICLRPISVNIDNINYVREDGKTALGDHFPLSATFIIDTPTALDDICTKHNNIEAIYSINGCRLTQLQHGINIIRYDDGTTRTIVK